MKDHDQPADPDASSAGGEPVLWSSKLRQSPQGWMLFRRYRRVRDLLKRYRRLQQTQNVQNQLLPNSRNRAGDDEVYSHFLVNYPGSPKSIESLTRWLPVLQRLHESSPVAVLVGDVTAYRAISAASDLPCYFGRTANEAEFVAQQLKTKVMIYVNQAKLNLREGGMHDMVHTFLGTPGGMRSTWLNNRLRLFDYVLAPDTDSKKWMASRLLHYDADRHVRVVGEHSKDASQNSVSQPEPSPVGSVGANDLLPQEESLSTDEAIDADEPLDSSGAAAADASSNASHSPIETTVDVQTAVTELLQIRDERDEMVNARDKALAERGIVLLKGGQA